MITRCTCSKEAQSSQAVLCVPARSRYTVEAFTPDRRAEGEITGKEKDMNGSSAYFQQQAGNTSNTASLVVESRSRAVP